MPNPLVSVMMPSHNAKETLPLALSSLVAQTYAEWECILVDDGSTDGSHEIIERVNDKRVNYFRLERNVGRGAARQIALDHARGDLLCFLDADDWLFPTKLARQVEFMSQEPTVSLVSAGVAVVDGADNIVGVRRRGASGSQTPVICGPFNRLQRPPIVLVPSMVRMGPAKRTRYDPRLYLAQDFAFLLEVLRGNHYAVLPDILYAYRESAPQTMKRMIETRRYDRMIYWSYRRRYPVQAGTQIMMASAKGLVYRVASRTGLGSRFVTRRSEPPSRADQDAFEQARENVGLIADRIFASPSQAAGVSSGGRFAPQPVQ